MLKKIGLFVLILIFSILSWKYFSRPIFKGKGAALRESLWEWRNAESDEDEYNAAEKISFYGALRRGLKKKKKALDVLSDDEKMDLEEVTDFFKDITEQIESLESSLSKDEISKITKSNANSIFRKLGRFESQSVKMEKCSYKDYQKLRKTYSAEDLYQRGILVGHLIQLGEKKFLESYISNLIKIIRVNPEKNEKYSTLVKFYYPRLIKPSPFVLKAKRFFKIFSGHDAKQLKFYRQELIETGLKEKDIDRYILNLALRSPMCLINVNFSFFKYAKKGYAKERAGNILAYLNEMSLEGKTLPDSIYDIATKIEELYKDGYTYNFFIKKISDERIELFSPGDDYEENTEDDISFGIVEKSR